jgi:hypothetical protein
MSRVSAVLEPAQSQEPDDETENEATIASPLVSIQPKVASDLTVEQVGGDDHLSDGLAVPVIIGKRRHQ